MGQLLYEVQGLVGLMPGWARGVEGAEGPVNRKQRRGPERLPSKKVEGLQVAECFDAVQWPMYDEAMKNKKEPAVDPKNSDVRTEAVACDLQGPFYLETSVHT